MKKRRGTESVPGLAVHEGWRDLPEAARGCAVALGNFDGVHRGHFHLLESLRAARPDLPLGVVTFAPHPRAFFRPQDPPFALTDRASQTAALERAGVSRIFILPFDAAFSQLAPEEFIDEVLLKGIGATHVACGTDFAFGRHRGGNTALLQKRLGAAGVGLTLVSPLADAQGPLSSTRVRRSLQEGYPETAAELLGRPWSIRGEVVHGERRGRLLGFPTANLRLENHIEPARGAYVCAVRLPDGRVFGGIGNVGLRPTVSHGEASRLEVHLLDFDGDLYGKTLEVALLRHLRSEKRFASLEALKAGIKADEKRARAFLKKESAPLFRQFETPPAPPGR